MIKFLRYAFSMFLFFCVAGVADAEVQSIISAESGGFIQSIGTIYKFAQVIGVALAVLMITAGGIYIAISGASPSKQAEGKDMILSAIWGLVLLFGAVLILNTINPRLTLLSAPRTKNLSLGVRPCNRGDVMNGDVASADCAFRCSGGGAKEDAFRFLSDVNQKKYGCVETNEICENPTDERIAKGECTYFLKPCTAQQDPGYPPTCYKENQSCPAAVIEACTPAVLTFGEASPDLQKLREKYNNIKARCLPGMRNAACADIGGLEGRIKDLEKKESAGAIIYAFVPDCDFPGSCKDAIHAESNKSNPQIGPGFRYKRLPYYPEKAGPKDAQCILVAYEKQTDDKDKDDELDIKIQDFKNRGGLKQCPPLSSFSATADSFATGESPQTAVQNPGAGGGAGAGGGGGGAGAGGGGGGAKVAQENPGGTCAGKKIPPLTPDQQKLHDAQVALFNGRVNVNSTCKCSNPNEATCTGLIGLPNSTIQWINKIAQDCETCYIQITGGTETGHNAHGPGRPVVDFHWDNELAKFLKENSKTHGVTTICTTSADRAYRIACSYNETKQHLHVKFES